jgi:segregation and condensation protein B
MSLKAKIEAVIYAAEEPVTLAQLAAIFADELPPPTPETPTLDLPMPDPGTEADPSPESLMERGFLDAVGLGPDYGLAEVALLTALKQEQASHPAQTETGTALLENTDQPPIAEPTATDLEAQAKRAARQRDREVREQLKAIVDRLIEEYSGNDRGMEIREVASGYRIATKPEYHDAVRAFVKSLKPAMKLSLQALETLAVIAYKQPITAPEVSEIRGVDSSGVLGGLIARKLVATAGRKQVIGRPILYKTTREFLLKFGLKDLNELPSIEEFEKLAGDIEIGEEEIGAEETMLPFDPTEAESEAAEVQAESTEPVVTDEGAPSLPTAPSSERACPEPVEGVGSTDFADEDSQTEVIHSEDHHG